MLPCRISLLALLQRKLFSTFFLLVLFSGLLLGGSSLGWAATLTSDKSDYQPGELATLTGSGFQAGGQVKLQVLHADGTPSTGPAHDPWYVVADESGNFVTTWTVCATDCPGSLLTASADGQSSGLHAEVSFTDALGTGRLSKVIPLDGGCVLGPVGMGVQRWEVEQGKMYACTLTNVT